MTRARGLVLAAVQAAAEPLAAGGLTALLGPQCDPATVYRALHWLEDQGLLGSFVFHCQDHGTERYYLSADLAHRHWFHCQSCHRFLDLGACTLEGPIAAWEATLGIRVVQHNLQLAGLCPDCRKT